MDMHIHMTYCSLPALNILLNNYLGYDLEREALEEFAALIDPAQMTPADISEVLIKNRRNKTKAVAELLEALKIRAEKKKLGHKMVGHVEEEEEEEEQEKRALDEQNINKIADQI